MMVFFAGGTGHPYFSTDTATALRAIEMDMHILLRMTMVMAVAELIFGYAAAILHNMDDAFTLKQIKHTRDTRLVESLKSSIQIHKTYRAPGTGYCS